MKEITGKVEKWKSQENSQSDDVGTMTKKIHFIFGILFFVSESCMRILHGQNMGSGTSGLQVHQLQDAGAQKMSQTHTDALWCSIGKLLYFILLFTVLEGSCPSKLE